MPRTEVQVLDTGVLPATDAPDISLSELRAALEELNEVLSRRGHNVVAKFGFRRNRNKSVRLHITIQAKPKGAE